MGSQSCMQQQYTLYLADKSRRLVHASGAQSCGSVAPHELEWFYSYFEADRLACPFMRWMGVLPSDIDDMAIPDNVLIPLRYPLLRGHTSHETMLAILKEIVPSGNG